MTAGALVLVCGDAANNLSIHRLSWCFQVRCGRGAMTALIPSD